MRCIDCETSTTDCGVLVSTFMSCISNKETLRIVIDAAHFNVTALRQYTIKQFAIVEDHCVALLHS
jgi:hypothetical protein